MPISPFYGNVDVVGAYDKARAANQESDTQTIQQAAVLQKLAMQQKAMAEQAQLTQLVKQYGGDPDKTIRALLGSGSPRGIELAAKLKEFVAKPKDNIVVPAGGTLIREGQPAYTAPFKPEKPDKTEPLNQIIGPDGKPVWATRSAAIGQAAPIGPTAEPLVQYINPSTGNPVWGTRAEAHGQRPATAAANQTAVVDPNAANLHGEQYIATLPPSMQNTVKGLIEYKLPLTGLSSRTGERRILFEHAAQADPNFNVAKYSQRQQVMKDFTSGVTANNITALDQALNHMGTLSKLADALKNNDIPAANAVANKWAAETGQPAPTNYAVAQSAVATELMRVFRQVNASEQETKDWISKFPMRGSPAQIQGALAQGAELLSGRVNALNNRWNNGMDVSTGYPKLMSPQAQQSLAALRARASITGAPAQGFSDAEKEKRYQEWKARQGQ